MHTTAASFTRSPWALAALSGLLLWAAFPPLGWWPLAWAAPVGWLLLIRRPETPRRFYLTLWLAAWGHWLLVLQGLRLAHPAMYLGWLGLAGYLAVYVPLFVALSRVAVHRTRTPLLVAAPVVWIGLELARGHALTGFSMALLGHTQVRWTGLIQISDIAGGYAVSGLVMFAAACLTQALAGWTAAPVGRPRWRAAWPLAALAVAIGGALSYGAVARRAAPPSGDTAVRELRVALIQGSVDTIFEPNPQRDAESFARYRQLSQKAFRDEPRLDLIVWPESMFTGTLGDVVIEDGLSPPPDVLMAPAEYERLVREWAADFQEKTRRTARLFHGPDATGQPGGGVPLLVGTDTQHAGPGTARRYNTALWIAPDGTIAGRYYKMHRVAFGEYIPWGDVFPWLYRLTPMTVGLTPGEQPRAFPVAGANICPSICFESTVPHLLRRQVTVLEREGSRPDLLVNVTNDGWFWGSGILDLHLICNVFRAVELRLPLVVAANTGFSAYIDRDGRIVQQAPRRAESVISSKVRLDGRGSWYRRHGDIPAGVCLVGCIGWVIAGAAGRRGRLRRNKRAE